MNAAPSTRFTTAHHVVVFGTDYCAADVVQCRLCGERLEVSIERALSDSHTGMQGLAERWVAWHLPPHTILDRDVRDYCAVA